MITLQQIALGYLGALLNDLQGIFGWSDATTTDIYNSVHDALTGIWWFLFSPPVAFLIGVWLAIKDASSAIAGWITDAAQFVTWYVKPLWTWLTTAVDALVAWVNQAAQEIQVVATNVFNALIGIYRDAINWLTTTLSAFGRSLTDLLQNFAARVTTVVTNFWNVITAPLKTYWDAFQWLWNNFGALLVTFLSNPIGVVQGWINEWIQTLLAPFRPLLDFLMWWTDVGAAFVVKLVFDPAGVILDVIAPNFLEWAKKLIADNW